MLDDVDPAVQLAVQRFQTQMPRFRDEFARKLETIHANLNARGILRSGVYAYEVQRVAQDEMRRRIFAARDAVSEVIGPAWSPTDAEVEDALSRCFQARDYRHFIHTDLEQVVSTAARATGIACSQADLDALDRSVSQVQVDAYNESVAALKTRNRFRGGERTVNIHNSGNLGALQVGDRNTAHVVQRVNPESAALIEAIAQLQRELAQAPIAPAIGALCIEATAEVQTAGITQKARGLLVGIAQLVQTVGAVPAAYPILLAAAHAVGVSLPALPAAP